MTWYTFIGIERSKITIQVCNKIQNNYAFASSPLITSPAKASWPAADGVPLLSSPLLWLYTKYYTFFYSLFGGQGVGQVPRQGRAGAREKPDLLA